MYDINSQLLSLEIQERLKKKVNQSYMDKQSTNTVT